VSSERSKRQVALLQKQLKLGGVVVSTMEASPDSNGIVRN
jgi:hypothetical protein